MNVFVNLPQTIECKQELAKRVADFHAILMMKKIKNLKIDDNSKRKIFSLILEHFKEKCNNEKNYYRMS